MAAEKAEVEKCGAAGWWIRCFFPSFCQPFFDSSALPGCHWLEMQPLLPTANILITSGARFRKSAGFQGFQDHENKLVDLILLFKTLGKTRYFLEKRTAFGIPAYMPGGASNAPSKCHVLRIMNSPSCPGSKHQVNTSLPLASFC